ncbi:hypothetical protein HOD83_02285 [Candidatus Woesearchaeota archaeon]|jgi:hypothetical protein|nr:hypothetical protein [Candidatus Woesearchaeota archaeon]MBT4114163.1 hypothetical protein [Candidatus Woesearchaeota archaeon]MBT4248394.1 hypothetical protein [Candidatus Woesearchaeota archaeon]
MKCPKCGDRKVERIILPRFDRIQISKFVEPGSKPYTKSEIVETIKCVKCGHVIKS